MNGKRLALIASLLPALAQAQGYGGLSAPAPGFESPKPGTPIVFPMDHGPHPAFRTEWWYLTANLVGKDGATYGAQWTLFRHALEPGGGEGWDNRTVFMGHAALTGATRHAFAQTMARGGVGQAGVEAAPFSAFIDDWSFTAQDTELTRARVVARGGHFSYSLELTRKGPFVLQGDKGFSLKSSAGQASHYYSAPFLSVGGRIAFDGREIEVTGRAWMDREWSSQSLSDDQKGWDWFSLHLASGEKAMIYRFRGAQTHCSGNWIAPDGTTQLLTNDDIALTPLAQTAIDGHDVPTRWRLQVKSRGLDIETRPLNPKSWMGTRPAYWEGPIAFAGSQGGEGYLEMTGY
jgi:predicted secreted hydrolase